MIMRVCTDTMVWDFLLMFIFHIHAPPFLVICDSILVSSPSFVLTTVLLDGDRLKVGRVNRGWVNVKVNLVSS